MSSPQVSSQPFQWHSSQFEDSSFQIQGRTLFYIVALFSVVIVLTVVFFYSRWVCRLTPPPPPNHHPATSAESHSAHDQPPTPPHGRGLDVATLNSMPIVLYGHSAAAGGGNFSQMECCICLGIFADREKVRVLPECRHCFHSECVDKWFAAHSSCPICRASLRVDSPV